MNRFEKRKLKANLYRHGNTIMYVVIFVMASLITIAAAANRTENIVYVDESTLASSESVEIKNSSTDKVAATETGEETVTETGEEKTTENGERAATEPETTQQMESEPQTEPVSVTKVKVTADTLIVRTEPSAESDMIGTINMDDVYEVVSQTGEWIEINYDGNKGYINSQFTEIAE